MNKEKVYKPIKTESAKTESASVAYYAGSVGDMVIVSNKKSKFYGLTGIVVDITPEGPVTVNMNVPIGNRGTRFKHENNSVPGGDLSKV